MASQTLPNYLLSHRKRSALSQGEVAYLLGLQSDTNISRYERFSREPGLQEALAYEAIFDRPVSELFPGLFEQTQMEVMARAKKLEQKQFRGDLVNLTARKRQALAAIASREPKMQLK